MTDEILTPLPIGPFFRFPDWETGMAALETAGLLTKDGEFITASHHHALDVIGTITRGGEWDDEGNVVVPPTTLDGWHVNLQGEVPEGWEQYAVWPRNPIRQWATASPPPGDGYVRARDEEGKFLPDDPATPDVNEAWVKV